MSLTLNDLVAKYVQLRDMIAEADKKHKDSMAPVRQTLQDLNTLLLGKLQTLGVDSVACESGTVYTKEKRTASIADGDLFFSFVVKQSAWDLIDKKANAPAVADYLQQFKVLPPGVNLTTVTDVGVRRG